MSQQAGWQAGGRTRTAVSFPELFYKVQAQVWGAGVGAGHDVVKSCCMLGASSCLCSC